mmetsp:Transcript_8236/g.13788  ORF Transcript_8236/g.13788 Transcript_8236/m.13788 type:complete len:114 (+) Transcript_8236:1385-1726(+)
MPRGKKLREVQLQQSNNLLLVTFEDSKDVALLQYNPKQMVKSLLNHETTLATSRSSLYELTGRVVDRVIPSESHLLALKLQGRDEKQAGGEFQAFFLENTFNANNFVEIKVQN